MPLTRTATVFFFVFFVGHCFAFYFLLLFVLWFSFSALWGWLRWMSGRFNYHNIVCLVYPALCYVHRIEMFFYLFWPNYSLSCDSIKSIELWIWWIFSEIDKHNAKIYLCLSCQNLIKEKQMTLLRLNIWTIWNALQNIVVCLFEFFVFNFHRRKKFITICLLYFRCNSDVWKRPTSTHNTHFSWLHSIDLLLHSFSHSDFRFEQRVCVFVIPIQNE